MVDNIINIYDKFINPIKRKIIARRIKLLKAEAHHKHAKVRKHEKKLLELELEYHDIIETYRKYK
jgi:hypothetical protein